jgi:hypothetical protein
MCLKLEYNVQNHQEKGFKIVKELDKIEKDRIQIKYQMMNGIRNI